MKPYLEVSECIDWDNPQVFNKAKKLSHGLSSHESIAKACFEFVRDEIKHSWDYRLNPVTCKASDVLQHNTGYCFAKSHLLAALLRANQIPAALCYQRLTISDGVPPFSLHGFNAIFLPSFGWYRVDARGNKEGVDAQFMPPQEQLAYGTPYQGEIDFPEKLSRPLDVVIKALTDYVSVQEVADNLPDTKDLNDSSL